MEGYGKICSLVQRIYSDERVAGVVFILSYKLLFFLVALLLAFSGASAGKSNDPVPTAWDRTFQLRVGVFFPDLDSSIRIDSDLGQIGDGLNFERDLGMSESKTTLYAGVSWRFARKHVLEWEFFDLGRDGLTTVEKSRNIGNTTILANGQISSAFNVRINRLTYKYRFFENSRTNMNFMVGLHGMRLNANLALSGNLVVDEEPVFVLPDEPDVEVEKTKFPLPHFGVGINYALTPQLIGNAMVKGFVLEVGDTYGRLIEANVGVQYQLRKNFGIGGGVKWFFLDVVVDETERADVKMEFDFFGPSIFLAYTF